MWNNLPINELRQASSLTDFKSNLVRRDCLAADRA